MTFHDRSETRLPSIASAVPFIPLGRSKDAPAGGGIFASRCYIHQRIGEWELTTPLQFIEVKTA